MSLSRLSSTLMNVCVEVTSAASLWVQASTETLRRGSEKSYKTSKSEELHAYYCQRNNLNKFKSCQRKVLETVANENIDDDGIIYKAYVSQREQEYAVDNQKLVKAFSKN